MTRRFYLPLTSIIFCSACAVGPKYQRPVAPAVPAFKEMAGSDEWKTATPSDGQLKGKWWEVFNDPQLNELEERISTANFTVKQLEAQFRASRAVVLGARANYYPSIGAAPSIRVTGVGGSGTRGERDDRRLRSIPFSATWVPDLWGRVRLAVEAANANAQVTAADLENTRLALQATLAVDYFNLVGIDMEIALLQDTIKAYQTYSRRLRQTDMRAAWRRGPM